MDQGSIAHQIIRRKKCARRKMKQRAGKKEDQCRVKVKKELDRRPTMRKIVRKWTSGVHLELGFLSQCKGFTHFVI
jgi:ribosomal protein S8E